MNKSASRKTGIEMYSTVRRFRKKCTSSLFLCRQRYRAYLRCVKERFKIIENGSPYGMRDQARIVMAICLVSNAVRAFDQEEYAVGSVIPRLQM